MIALVPFEAHAQDVATPSVAVNDRPRPEYDPLGMRFGGFDLNAKLDVGVASTDNLFAVDDSVLDPKSDLVYTVSPEARLSSHWSRHALSIAAGITQTGHRDFTSEDSTTGFVAGSGRLDIGRDTTVSGDARWAREVEPRTNIDAIHANTGEPSRYDVTQGSVAVAHTFNNLQVRASAARTELDYLDVDGISQAARNSKENAGTLHAEYEISPRVGIVGEATFDDRNYDNAVGLSSNGRTLLAGVAINFTDLLQGQVTVGQFKRDYDVGPDVSGTAIAAHVQWFPTQLTTVTFDASRNAGDRDATVQAPYVQSSYGVHVDHELLRNLILSAGYQAGTRDFEGFPRKDDFNTGEVGARYILNRRVALTAQYRHDSVNTNAIGQDYNVNSFSLGLSLRL